MVASAMEIHSFYTVLRVNTSTYFVKIIDWIVMQEIKTYQKFKLI